MLEDSESEERERRERAEVLRRQRSQEAQQLIAKRTIDARAVFEQNTCVMQMNTRRSSYQVNGIQKQESSTASPDISPNEQPFAAARKGSLPAWLPESTNAPTKTEIKEANTNVANGDNESASIEKLEPKPIEEEEEERQEQQEWEGSYHVTSLLKSLPVFRVPYKSI